MLLMEFTPTKIYIVEASAVGKSLAIKKAFSTPMPIGAFFNGQIRDVETIARCVRGILLENNIRKGKVCFSLDSTSIKRKDAVVPDVKRENILSILNKEMADIIASEAHVIDYTVYEKFKQEKKAYMRCVLYALPKELVERYIALAKESNLELVEIDVHFDGMSKLWELEDSSIKRSTPLPKNTKKLKLKKKKKVEEVEEAEEAEEAVSDVFQMDGPMRLWIGLYRDSIRFITNGIDGNSYGKTVVVGGRWQNTETLDQDGKQEMVEEYIEQIKAFLQFVLSSSSKKQIDEIYLYGNWEEMSELIGILRSGIGCQVELLKRPKKIKGIEPDLYPEYCGAIGAGLRR